MAFTATELRAMLRDIADLMAAERDNLCALDAATGDGDHGIAMANGFAAAARSADAAAGDSLGDLLRAAGMGLLDAVGASSGPLYATALMNAGKHLGAATSIPSGDLRGVIVALAEGIKHRGKAQPGQRTMVDAWQPAADAAASGAEPGAIAAAADAGAKATANMSAGLGRSAKLGERVLGHPDPGAVSAAMIVGVICRSMAAE